MKHCLVCLTEKPEADFHHSGTTRNRVCWDCRLRYHQERRIAQWASTWEGTRHRARAEHESTPRASTSPAGRDLAWVAGFLEGEGWFRCQGGVGQRLDVGANQKDYWPLERVQRFCGGAIRDRVVHGRALHEWRAHGQRAHGIMLTLYTLLCGRRQNQIRAALGFSLLPEWQVPSPAVVAPDVLGKRCLRCGETKPLEEFGLNRGRRINECRDCKKTYLKRRYEEKKAGVWSPGRQGQVVSRVNTPAAACSPRTLDLEWIAGFLEAEGTFRRTATSEEVNAPQASPEPLWRLQRWLGGAINRRSDNHLFTWHASGARARGIMLTLYPLLSPRRQAQIRAALGR